MKTKTIKYGLGLLALFTPFLTANAQPTTAQGVIDVFASIVGYVSVAFWIAATAAILYAGFLYLTAGGDAEKVKKASKMLWYAVIAIAVGLMADTMPTLVQNILGGGGT